MPILTEELIERAIDLVTPAAEKILNTEGMTWEPKWVRGIVRGPFGDSDMSFEFGDDSNWESKWGEEYEFRKIAQYKLNLADEQKMPTSAVVALWPWVLKDNDYLYPGAVHNPGITVAISGARSRVDEGLANMVLSAIMMLCYLETDKRTGFGTGSRQDMRIS